MFKFLPFSVVGLSALLLASTAFAATSLTVDEKATLSASKTSVTVTGTIVCPLGNFAFVTASVIQASGQTEVLATGSDDLICTGQVQSWALTANVLVGEALKSGPAITVISASDCTGDPTVPPEDPDEDPVVCTVFPASVHTIKLQK